MSKKSGSSSGGAKKEDEVDKNRKLIRKFLKSYEQLCADASQSPPPPSSSSGSISGNASDLGASGAFSARNSELQPFVPYAPFVQKLAKLAKSEEGPPLDLKTVPITLAPPPELTQQDLALFLQAITSGYPYYADMSFQRVNLADIGTMTLCRFIHENPILTKLELIDNRIGALGSKHLGKAIQNNVVLQSLKLDFNPLGDEGCVLLSLGLAWSTSLRSLSLQYCQIGSEGMITFSEEVLNKNQSLTSIDLTGNEIGTEGIISIAKALPTANPQLKSLNLSSTCPFRDCGDKGYDALDQLCSGIEEQGMDKVRDVLKQQQEEEQEQLRIEQEKEERRLRGEYVPTTNSSENKKRPAPKKSLDQLLGEQYLTEVNLSRNSLDARCAQRLLDLLTKRITITHLKVHEQIETEVMKKMIWQQIDNRTKAEKRAKDLAKARKKMKAAGKKKGKGKGKKK